MENQPKDVPPVRAGAPRSADTLALLEELSASGLRTAAFARSKGLPAWKLYNALQNKAKRERAKPTALVPIKFAEPRGRGAAPLELILSCGHRLLVPKDFDEVALRRLMGVLVGC